MDFGGAIMTGSLLVGALLLAAIPVIRLITWWVDGQVDAIVAVLAIVVYMTMLVAVVSGPTPVKLVVFLELAVSAVGIPLFSRLSDASALKGMETSKVDAYMAALERDPTDPVPRIAMAEVLAKRGDLAGAVQQMEWVVQQYPRLALHHKAQLDSWRRELANPAGAGWVICHMCHAENAPGATMCSQCGAMFGAREGMVQRIYREGGPKLVIRSMVIGNLSLLLAIYLMLTLPAIIAGPIVLAGVLVGAWLFMRWVGGDLGVIEH